MVLMLLGLAVGRIINIKDYSPRDLLPSRRLYLYKVVMSLLVFVKDKTAFILHTALDTSLQVCA